MTELIKLIRELLPTVKAAPVAALALSIIVATFAKEFGNNQWWRDAMMQVGTLGFVASIAWILSSLFKPQIGPILLRYSIDGLLAGFTGAFVAAAIDFKHYSYNYYPAMKTCVPDNAGMAIGMHDLSPLQMLFFVSLAGLVVGAFVAACIPIIDELVIKRLPSKSFPIGLVASVVSAFAVISLTIYVLNRLYPPYMCYSPFYSQWDIVPAYAVFTIAMGGLDARRRGWRLLSPKWALFYAALAVTPWVYICLDAYGFLLHWFSYTDDLEIASISAVANGILASISHLSIRLLFQIEVGRSKEAPSQNLQ